MNKSILILVAVLLILPGAALAWHCEDTDESRPSWNGTAYGEWGDNAALGGFTWGWYDVGVTLPNGCVVTGNYQAECTDLCVDTTLREFDCYDRPGYPRETVIGWVEYPDWEECGGNEVPEFSPIVAGALVIAAAGALLVFRKK